MIYSSKNGLDSRVSSSAGDPCHFAMSIGQGKASLERWFFNADTRRCEQFTYRGILGNANNFVQKQDCEQVCPGSLDFCLIHYIYL